jgi:glycosyltransferase involved in cell wall biosynthesis
VKICYVYQDQYPWDVRVEKIVESFAQRGIETHVISRNRNALPRVERLGPKLYVHRLPYVRNKALREVVGIPAFFSPFWLWRIANVIRRTKAELLIVRDLPLAPCGALAAKLSGIPVMMDMAENYPEMIRDNWAYVKPQRMDYLIRNPDLLKMLEKWVVKRMHGVLVVSEASAKRIMKIGVKPERVWVVGNTPRLEWISDRQVVDKRSRELGKFIILYVGGLEEARGLEIAVRALPHVVNEIPGCTLLIVGSGPSEERLKRLAGKLDVGEHVVFMGWREPGSIPGIIAGADICIVPHYVTEHTDTTVPNKIFDYMAQRKPVLVTHSRTLADIVQNYQCGRVYHDRDYDELARMIVGLKDPNVREAMGNAGFRAVIEKLNWGVDEENLIQAAYYTAGKGIRCG